MSASPEVRADGVDTPNQRPARVHKVLAQFADTPVHPALCGFIIRPSNEVSLPQAASEGARDCEECLTILLELEFALS